MQENGKEEDEEEEEVKVVGHECWSKQQTDDESRQK